MERDMRVPLTGLIAVDHVRDCIMELVGSISVMAQTLYRPLLAGQPPDAYLACLILKVDSMYNTQYIDIEKMIVFSDHNNTPLYLQS